MVFSNCDYCYVALSYQRMLATSGSCSYIGM